MHTPSTLTIKKMTCNFLINYEEELQRAVTNKIFPFAKKKSLIRKDYFVQDRAMYKRSFQSNL